MTDAFVCQHCGAPWQPDVTGACRFCHIVAPPTGAPRNSPGAPTTGGAGGRPNIDADALCRLLLAATSDSSRPLDGLAADLRGIVGDRCSARGSPVSRVQIDLDDWQYQAWTDHGDPAAQAVHTVRGVVLKRQPLPFDEWLACVAAHLGEYAGTHRRVYEAIVALDHS